MLGKNGWNLLRIAIRERCIRFVREFALCDLRAFVVQLRLLDIPELPSIPLHAFLPAVPCLPLCPLSKGE